MISQLFIQSPRGDVIIYKDFKGNVLKSATDTFFRKATLWEGQGKDAPPVFQSDGIQFIHVRVGGLFWVATTRENVSPSLVLELLMRMYWITRDYLGIVSEESVRRNFVLIYELLDEVLDYGFPQNSSTERLKQFIAMEPAVSRPRVPPPSQEAASTPTDIVKSVLDTARTGTKEEIFVDIVEKLTAIFDSSGHLRASNIVGSIQVKSYLTGNPPIRLGLCDNIVLGHKDSSVLAYSSEDYGSSSGGPVVLDTYSLHEAVDSEAFDRDRVIELVPPEGHFSLLTYRSSRSFRPPLRVYPVLEDDAYSAEKLTLYVRLRAEYESTKTATGIEVTIPLPGAVERVHCDVDSAAGDGSSTLLASIPGKASFSQHAEWKEREKKVVWSLKHLRGGKEHVLKVRITIPVGTSELVKQDYGPLMVQFVLPGKPSASGMDVKYMKVLKGDLLRGQGPSRWFRVVALANSYQIRTG